MSKIPTEQETIKMLACLPFALDPTLPKDAEDQLRSVFTAYIDLMKNHQAMKEALEEFCRLYSEPNYWKECTPGSAYTKAKLALTLANGKDKEP